MHHVRARAPSPPLPVVVLLALLVAALAGACERPATPLAPRAQTWAELRVVRRGVTVQIPAAEARAPYPRERLVDGAVVTVGPEGVAWIRRDAGATFLVRGPAKLTLRQGTLEVAEGKLFVDTPGQAVAEIETPSGPVQLSRVRASIDVGASGATSAYVLAGEVRAGDAARAGAGELLTLQGKGAELRAKAEPVVAWDDWTGGLATTDRAAQPAPYGVGTVGARAPGATGAPRFPLAIERLDVRVTIEGDFATTEVDQVFFNPSPSAVEGIYRFRTPEGASLARFGVDRGGAIAWGRVKEKQAAAQQYESNVYAGSKEDPALLEWESPGTYKARLYPIGAGEARRVVVRYSEWLGRTGAKGERRMYVYPMAAEGAEGSLPAIEELSIAIDLAKSGAKEVRAGMKAARSGHLLVVRDHDVVPRADLAVELFDDGPMGQAAYAAPHGVDVDALPPSERDGAIARARSEADYVLVPLRATDLPLPSGGLDLAIVIDASAATDAAQLALARAAVGALLAHVGKEDRAVVWAGDVGLRPVVPGRAALAPVDDEARRAILTGLSSLERGGATDVGAMLSAAAATLDPARRGAVVYIGDGAPTVGELSLRELRERMAKLPRPVRIFGLGVGEGADMALLSGLARGAFAERVGDANAAARAALRLFEAAERPVWLGAKVDLGSAVERVFPRDLGAQVADETMLVVGRITPSGKLSQITVTTPAGEATRPVTVTRVEDGGDLRRRWAEAQLYQMMDEAAGRAAMVDLGVRHGIITPVTSLYVPTTNEMTPEERAEIERRVVDERRARMEAIAMVARLPDGARERDGDEDEEEQTTAAAASLSEKKEGGTGARAKGEEGAMGAPGRSSSTSQRDAEEYTKNANKDAPVTRAPAAGEVVAAPAAAAPPSEPEPWPSKTPPQANEPRSAAGNMWGAPIEPGLVGGGVGWEAPEAGAKSGDAAAAPSAAALAAPTATMDTVVRAPPSAPRPSPDPGFDAGMVGNGNGDLDDGRTRANVRRPSRPMAAIPTAEEAQTETAAGDLEAKRDGFDKGQNGLETDDVDRLSNAAPRADIAVVSRVLTLRCSAAAALPLDERAALWRERLAQTGGNAARVASVYHRALATCEAATLRDRSRLLQLMLDATKTAAGRVDLWRRFMARPEGDTLYRGMLSRVRTADEMRELHRALGLRSIDSATLKKLLDGAKTPEARAAKLRELVREWPDDFALALLLLDALEDAGLASEARDLGKKLRARPDADARLRTAAGELFLRLAARAASPEEKAADEAEARRAFGEIVEFAPDDPVARRRLGDLLRAHGWFDEAARQYETLAKLTPDDPAVDLLRAAAAQGLGKLEEAVKWTEKAGASGAPDMAPSAASTARALAITYLAWERDEARAVGRKDEVDTLAARAARIVSGGRAAGTKTQGARATLVWSHPDLHPTLWSNALGAAMPAQEQDMATGVAHVVVPVRDGAFVEVRIDPEDAERAARLGATATLTVILHEGEENERVRRFTVKPGPGALATQRFQITESEVSP